jgi:hypothetical protein
LLDDATTTGCDATTTVCDATTTVVDGTADTMGVASEVLEIMDWLLVVGLVIGCWIGSLILILR